jgi:uncharacterized lipoprotein YddW (UPF0748 family)
MHRMESCRHWLLMGCLAWAIGLSAAPPVLRGTPPPPELPRELRAAWIATKANIDWPSKPGLPMAEAQRELRELLEMARSMGLNAVVFQVRPQGDAFFESTLEPWSEYLTGHEGLAPSPRWDPLEFAVREGHARGLEVHAWINPFRAKTSTTKSPASSKSLARRRPDLVVTYGAQTWMDPGLPEVRDHGLRVVADLTKRYDIDAVHCDDYFYPYPVKDANGRVQPFPDEASYRKHGRGLGKSDWRRWNVDEFVRRAAEVVHREKPWVQFGISPFGIWRPDVPPGIKGLDAYEVLAADARRWMMEGWVDYLVPQLYWNISQREQSFPVLLHWWGAQNPRNRHLYAGIASARIGTDRNAAEISSQVRLTQQFDGADGVMFWNGSSLRKNRGGVVETLKSGPLSSPALIPASPWLWTNGPVLTRFDVKPSGRTEYVASWEVKNGGEVRQWGLQVRRGVVWSLEVLPPGRREARFTVSPVAPAPAEVRLVPVGRAGAAGAAGYWRQP